ncbi:conjugative transposon TraN protein [Bacteroides thetaiotaomicron CAG:40]|nr:conjugative transposon TraN protein [Bacteroides thetaiotaomicron CAG:40]
MKKLMILFALILGVVSVKAQSNDLYQGITKKLPYRQMVTPYGVQVTFAKTVHIIFPSAVKYVDLGSNYIIAGKADGAENVVRVKALPPNGDTLRRTGDVRQNSTYHFPVCR